MGSTRFQLETLLQSKYGTSGFCIINLLIFDGNLSVTLLLLYDVNLGENYKIKKSLGTSAVMKKEELN